MLPTKNNFKMQIKACYQSYKETGNGVWKLEARRYYQGYKGVGGTMALKEIIKSELITEEDN